MTLGNRLKHERRSHRLSQYELAEIGGIRPNAQGHYENGMRLPRADYLLRLHSTGLDVKFIVTGVRTPLAVAGLSIDEDTLLRAFRGIYPDDQRAVAQIITTLALNFRDSRSDTV